MTIKHFIPKIWMLSLISIIPPIFCLAQHRYGFQKKLHHERIAIGTFEVLDILKDQFGFVGAQTD